MTPPTATLDELRERANELYWSSPDTVEQLAATLGMSRKAVYAAVRPLSAGSPCLQCGDVLVFTNRTSRAARAAQCPGCGSGTTLDEETMAAAAASGLGAADGAVHPVPGPRARLEQFKEDLAAVPPERAAKIGGAAALGVALGAAAVKAIKKRR